MIFFQRLFGLVSVLIIWSCSPNKQAGVQDFPNTLQASAQAALFDLPSSVQSETTAVQVNSPATSLAKIVASTSLDTNEDRAYSAYLAVPIYIHIANAAKEGLQSLIHKLASQNLPAHWNGAVDSLYVITEQIDSSFNGQHATYYSLTGRDSNVVRIKLAFFENDSNEVSGRFYELDPTNHHARIRIDYNGIGIGGDQSMTILFRIDTSGRAKVGDPTTVWLHAIKRKTSGHIAITGASYHPTYIDSFWGNGPKVYGFQALSNPSDDQSVLRVAFANADSVGANFYSHNALDSGILRLATERMRVNLSDSASWLKVVNFCLDSSLSITAALNAPHLLNLAAYVPVKTPADFTEADYVRFLNLNQQDIFASNGSLASLRGLYDLIHIQQPLYLQANATLVGFGGTIPTSFSLPANAIESEGLSDEVPATIATMDANPN